jgi:GntR family transcriptional regulator/MocR family aminotransferase
MQIVGAQAGMHLVITLPDGMRDTKISTRAAEQHLWLWPLSPCYSSKNVRQGFILGFAGTKAEEMEGAVRRLRGVLTDA